MSVDFVDLLLQEEIIVEGNEPQISREGVEAFDS